MNKRTLTFATALLVLATALLIALPSPVAVTGQTSTGTVSPTVAGPTSDVTAFFVACDTQAVMNLSGSILANYDIYYQVFSGANGTGTALTGFRQVSVAGDFSVSETVTYTGGATVAAATSASARVVVARETDSTNIDFEFNVNDVQDGCSAPQFTNTTVTDTGTTTSTTSTTATTSIRYGVNRNILGPNGTTLNPNLLPEAEIVIGARQTDRYRSETPGLIFAECDAFALAEPGLIYDTDGVTIFWSWYTKTLAQMQDHLDHAIYTVELNTASLPMTARSEPVRRDGNYWVFYTANVGNLRPGHYEVGYQVTWNEVVNDGYGDFGPGTSNPFDNGICNFDVLPNTTSTSVTYTGMYFPTTGPVHNIDTD